MRFALIAFILLLVSACGKESVPPTGSVEPPEPNAGKDSPAGVVPEESASDGEGVPAAATGEIAKAGSSACGGNAGTLAVDGALPPEGNCGGGAVAELPKDANVASKAIRHFGGDFTLTDALALETVLDKSESFSGKNVKVRGAIEKVCKKKGCWFTVRAGEAESARFVRITMKDYGFFVPLDCDGKTAIIEGVFTEKVVEEPMRKHLATDGGEDPDKIKGKTKEFRLVATAIDIEG